MARLKKDQIITAVYRQIEDSEGYESDELAAMREMSLDYYYNRPSAAPSSAGRSALQSSDVADMVEAVIAQVMPAFEIDNVVEFEPSGEDDVDQARAESDACSYVIMQQNNGHYEVQQAVRDALMLRNGVIKVFLDEKESVENVTATGLTELEYGDLMRQSVDNIADVDNGLQVETLKEHDGFYDVRLTSKRTERKVCSQAIDPGNFMWERDHDSIYLDDCQFVAERSFPTRSELIERGYSKSVVNSLNAGSMDTALDTRARNQHSHTTNYKGDTPATDLIEFFECYIRLDADGDGIAELLKVCVAGKKILEMDDAPFIPYASGTPFLQPHRFNGLGLFDKLRYIQDAKTATLRQLVDNQNHANNSRVMVVDGMVNVDDVTNSRPGGVVRVTSPDAVIPFPFADIGPTAISTLEYMDKIRSERGGASLDMQSAEMQVAGDTAHGVERQMSAKEQLAAMMTRTIAETLFRSTFMLTHKALRLYVPDKMQFRSSDKFVTVNPSEWPERDSMTVKSGLSLAERMRKKAALESVVMRQDAMRQQGRYVSPEDSYYAETDWLRIQGIDDAERYFTDPRSEEAQQWQQQQQQAQQAEAQKQEAYQAELLALQKEVESRKADNEDAKVMEDQRQFDADLQFKYWEKGLDQETKEAEMATTVAMEIVGGSSAGQESTGGSAAAGE